MAAKNKPRNKALTIVVIAVLGIVVINVFPIKLIINLVHPNEVSFSNADGSFTMSEYFRKGDDYELVKTRLGFFKEHVRKGEAAYKEKDTTTLYRLDKKNPFAFWNYGDYLFNEKYRLPYKNWSKIEQQRGPKSADKFQSF